MALSLKKISYFREGLDHPECVAVHPDGSVWAGGEAGQIYRISADGKQMEEVANTGGFVLGLAFSPDASWLAICDIGKKCVLRFDIAERTMREFARGAGKETMSIPNFPCFARDGALYVSDSGTFRKVNGRIFRFDNDHSGRGHVWHKGPFNFSNGLALAPDESALYAACTWLPGVERIAIDPDGTAGKRSVFAKFTKAYPDGLAFDARGNLYVSCYMPARIYKVTPQKKVSVFVDDWDAHLISNPTNIAFGGPKFDQIFAANLGRWHIARLDAKIKGSPLACHRAAKI